jgi:hypothetical protein
MLYTYKCWTTVDGSDLWLHIQAKNSLQARSIVEGLYGRCYAVESV